MNSTYQCLIRLFVAFLCFHHSMKCYCILIIKIIVFMYGYGTVTCTCKLYMYVQCSGIYSTAKFRPEEVAVC